MKSKSFEFEKYGIGFNSFGSGFVLNENKFDSYPFDRDFKTIFESSLSTEAYNGHRFESVGLLEDNPKDDDESNFKNFINEDELLEYYLCSKIDLLYKEKNWADSIFINKNTPTFDKGKLHKFLLSWIIDPAKSPLNGCPQPKELKEINVRSMPIKFEFIPTQ